MAAVITHCCFKRLYRIKPITTVAQAKPEANSNWLARGTRPASIPRHTM